MIASGVILTITFASLLMFAFSTLLLYVRYPKSRSVRLLGYYFFCFFLGLVATSLRNKIPDFFSLQLGIMTFAVGYMFLFMGLKDLLGLDSMWHNRYYIPIAILFIGIFFFTYIYYDLHMRIVIFSLYITIYTLATAWLFYKASTDRFKKLNHVAALLYFIVASIFVLRALNASTFGYHVNILYTSQFIVNSPYILLTATSIILIVVSNIYLRNGVQSRS